jgi:hypothetical protein
MTKRYSRLIQDYGFPDSTGGRRDLVNLRGVQIPHYSAQYQAGGSSFFFILTIFAVV